MKRALGVTSILAGVLMGGLGLAWLPEPAGRFQHAIAVVDPRPADEAETPQGLAQISVTRRRFLVGRAAPVATRAVVFQRPEGAQGPAAVLMLERLREHVTSADCQLGRLPIEGLQAVLAGAESGLERGDVRLGSETLQIQALLGRLGPLFDAALVMEPSHSVEAALREAGWQPRVEYLLLVETWGEGEQVLAQLRAKPDLLPASGSEILRPGRAPSPSGAAMVALAVLLMCVGLAIVGLQCRGLSRAGLAERFRRHPASD